jgi:glycosyltransferase involved in cell wall biosynthesis
MNNRQWKICYVVESASAGVGRHLGDLIEGLSQRELAEIHVLWSPTRADERFIARLERSGVQQKSIPMRRAVGPADLTSLSAIRAYLKTQGPFDLVHGHSSKGGALARLAAGRTASRVVYTPHAFAAMDPVCGRLKKLFYRQAEIALARVTDRIIATSPAERDFALQLGIPSHKLTVIPNGVEPEPLPSSEQARRQLGLDAERVIVGFVGRLTSQKNPELLVEAFSRVAGRFPDARLVMVGDGPQAASVRSLVERCGLSDRVMLPGALDGRRLMPAFDVLALTSRYEGLPYVLLEALLAGLPLLVTDTSGQQLIVDEGINGFVVPADAAMLADRLGRLLADKSLRKQMSSSALAKAAEFGVEQMVDGVLEVYQELCPRRRAVQVVASG